MVINLGPQHPATHGVLRLALELEGERVVSAHPDIGYLHSGFEKTGENKRYEKFIPYTDRMDYLAGMNNNLAYVLTVEKLLGIEAPPGPSIFASSWPSCSALPVTFSGWLPTPTMSAAPFTAC